MINFLSTTSGSSSYFKRALNFSRSRASGLEMIAKIKISLTNKTVCSLSYIIEIKYKNRD
jgi:hypothetical protein